jgi:pyruvate formate lyase activating enzyme
MSEKTTRKLAPVLDAINIDIKAFSEDFYHTICGARLQPVLDTVRLMHELGVWVEVTTLIIPGLNDSDAELRAIADFIVAIDPSMPWHVTAFYPTYKLTDRPATPAHTLQKARNIGLSAGLRCVYEGNIPGAGGENTTCPSCQALLVQRFGFRIQENRLVHGRCPQCGERLAGIWE